MTKIITIVGTRPEIIKMSRIISKIEENFSHTLVHTGQNYDYELNQIFFDELKIKQPDYYLDAAKETALQTIGNIFVKFEKICLVGHSMGGYISFCYAERYPERIENLTLIGLEEIFNLNN